MNVIPLYINSADRVDIADSTTDFTIELRKSLRNITAIEVSNVAIPNTELLINVNNNTLSGDVLVDAVTVPFSVQVPDGNYDGAGLAAALQAQLNENTAMLSFPVTWIVTYTPQTLKMTITATYALGAAHLWGIVFDFTAMIAVLGLGNAGTVAQTFMAPAGATVLAVPCNRVVMLTHSPAYNITSARLTDSINTSYIRSLAKEFTIGPANNTLTFNSRIVTGAHVDTLPEPAARETPPNQFMGDAVSMSSDGTIVVIGSSGFGAYVFTQTQAGGTWMQLMPTPLGPSAAQAGVGVAIAGNGNSLAVGAPGAGSNGAVYVFGRIGPTWNQTAGPLIGSGTIGVGVAMGQSVSLSIDGSTLAFGGPGDNGGIGAVWIWELSGGVWTQQAQLIPTGAIGTPQFGTSVSLSGSGDTIVVGGPQDNSGAGAVWTSVRTGVAWAPMTKIVPGDAVGAGEVGASVAMAANGLYLAFGAPEDNTTGASWIYDYTGTWIEQQKIVAPSRGIVGVGATTGGTVALDAAGDTLVIGAYYDDPIGPEPHQGSISIYTRSGSVWTEQVANLVGDAGQSASQQQQGSAVAISANGLVAASGGPYDASQLGAAWMFTLSGLVWTQSGSKLVGSGGIQVHSFGAILAISGDGATIVAGMPWLGGNTGSTFVYVDHGLVWAQQAELSAVDVVGTAQQGTAVALSPDGNTLIVGGPGDNGGLGAVWIWGRVGATWTEVTKITGQPPLIGLGATVALSAGPMFTMAAGGAAAPGLRIVVRIGANWATTVNQLLGTSAFAASAPTSVNISADGAVIGVSAGTAGAAVFALSGAAWAQQGPDLGSLLVPLGDASRFGAASALSADGGTFAIGSTRDGASGTGCTYMFVRANGAWSQSAVLVGSGASANGLQGATIAMGNGGASFVVGAPVDNGGLGMIWVFDLISGVWTQRGAPTFGVRAGEEFGTRVVMQPLGGEYAVGSIGAPPAPGNVDVFVVAGEVVQFVVSVVVPNKTYTVFDIVNVLNALMTDLIGTGSGYTVTFDGEGRLTLAVYSATPIVASTFVISPASTFAIARWPSTTYAPTQVSALMDFSINNDVMKTVVVRGDHDAMIVDRTNDLQYRKYPPGYTVAANELIDIQLRDDRDRVIDLGGADWIMTVYATIHA